MDKETYQARVEWMKRYRKAKSKERALCIRLAEARDCASSIRSTSSSVRVQTSDGVSGIQRAVESIERAEGTLLDQREVCNALYRETLMVILRVPDAKQRRVLRLRYLAGWTMDRIAEDMDISIPTVKRLHSKAIIALDMIHLTC